MDVNALFGLSALMSLVASIVAARLYVWPRLRSMDRYRALALSISPHLFFPFIGLTFLVPGVVSPSLPSAFAVPAAYGDLVAGVLAIVAILALTRRASWAPALVWAFNVWGAADFLFAGFQGQRLQIDPGAFGAAFFIPTAVVPPLLVTHALIFLILVRPRVPGDRRAA
jgi:hypothetical protein